MLVNTDYDHLRGVIKHMFVVIHYCQTVDERQEIPQKERIRMKMAMIYHGFKSFTPNTENILAISLMKKEKIVQVLTDGFRLMKESISNFENAIVLEDDFGGDVTQYKIESEIERIVIVLEKVEEYHQGELRNNLVV